MYVFYVSSKCSISVYENNLQDALSHLAAVFGDKFVCQNIDICCSEGMFYPDFLQDVEFGDIVNI